MTTDTDAFLRSLGLIAVHVTLPAGKDRKAPGTPALTVGRWWVLSRSADGTGYDPAEMQRRVDEWMEGKGE